jgi:hypothetical protein
MNGKMRQRVKLELGILSHNLLLEEYPLAEQHLTQIDEERWLLNTEIADYAGVARFVVGLMDDVRIVDSPDLESYIADYVARNWPKVADGQSKK